MSSQHNDEKCKLDEAARQIASLEEQKAWERFATDLHPHIKKTVRRLMDGVDWLTRDEFTEAAADHVFQKLQEGKFNPDKANFKTWCRRVVVNLKNDFFRKTRRTPAPVPTPPEEIPQPGGEMDFRLLEERLDNAEPFNQRDLRTLQSIKPPLRMVLLCFTGWIAKVPETQWREWLEEVDFLTPQTLFQIVQLPDPRQRRETVASEAAPKARDGLAKRWERAQEKLIELEYFWEVVQVFPPLSSQQLETLQSWPALEQLTTGAVERFWMRFRDGELMLQWKKEVPRGAKVHFFVLAKTSQESRRLQKLAGYLKMETQEVKRPWERRKDSVANWGLVGGADHGEQ